MEKKCSRCGESKPLSEFYVKGHGLQARCKSCCKKSYQEYISDQEVHKKLLTKWAEHRRKNREVRRKASLDRIAKLRSQGLPICDPFKYRARRIARDAVKSGKLQKPNACSTCGWTGHIEIHHEDYNKPLEVSWLCRICHGIIHRQHK